MDICAGEEIDQSQSIKYAPTFLVHALSVISADEANSGRAATTSDW